MKVLLRTRVLRPYLLKLGPLAIRGLVVVDESWGETRVREKKDSVKLLHSLYNVAANRTYRAVKSGGGFVETEAVGIGAAALDGDGSYSEAKALMFPKPSRLIRVGVAWAGRAVEKLDDMDWYEVPAQLEFYIYEGSVEAEKPWEMLVLDTEDGQRIILPSELKPPRRHAGEKKAQGKGRKYRRKTGERKAKKSGRKRRRRRRK